MNKLIFIDTENVHDYSALKILKLTSRDTVVYACSQHTPNMNVSNLECILSNKAKTEFIASEYQSKNYMDFVIVTNLAEHCIAQDFKEGIIISDDKGYDAILTYLSKKYGIPLWRLKPSLLFIDWEDLTFLKALEGIGLSTNSIKNLKKKYSVATSINDYKRTIESCYNDRSGPIWSVISEFLPKTVF